MRWSSVLLLLGSSLMLSVAKVTTGAFYKENDQWVVLDTFFFDSNGGELEIEGVITATKYPNQYLAIYHDLVYKDGGFPVLLFDKLPCDLKLSLAAKQVHLNHTSVKSLDDDLSIKYSMYSMVPRKWYLVLANCEAKPGGLEGVGVEDILIRWTNGNSKDKPASEISRFELHFSWDEQGIFEMMIISLLVLLILIPVTTFFLWRATKDEGDLSHRLLATLLVAELFHLLSVLLELSHRDTFSYDGIGKPALEDAHHFFHQVPCIVFVGMFMVVGKGLYISEEELKDMRSVVQVLMLYFGGVIGMIYWEYLEEDVAADYFAYWTTAGNIITAMRVVIALWFIRELLVTYRRESMRFKRNFYLGIGFLGVLYLLAIPLFTLVEASITARYRVKVQVVMEQIVMLVVELCWFLLFYKNRSYVRKAGSSSGATHNKVNTDESDV